MFSNKQSLVLYNLWKYQTHLELLRILENSANYWPAGVGELLLFKHLLKYVTSSKCEQSKMHSDPAIWAATGAVRSISPQQWEFKPCTAHPGPSLPSCHQAGLVPVPLKCQTHPREGGRKTRNNFLDPCRSRCCSGSVGVLGAGEFLLLCLQKKGGNPPKWPSHILNPQPFYGCSSTEPWNVTATSTAAMSTAEAAPSPTSWALLCLNHLSLGERLGLVQVLSEHLPPWAEPHWPSTGSPETQQEKRKEEQTPT